MGFYGSIAGSASTVSKNCNSGVFCGKTGAVDTARAVLLCFFFTMVLEHIPIIPVLPAMLVTGLLFFSWYMSSGEPGIKLL